MRGEWERIGKEVEECKEWQMNANAGESGKGVGGGWRRWGGKAGMERAEEERG